MSLLTFLDKNFNGSKYRFKKAVGLIGEKNYDDAERLLIDILGVHPEAEIRLNEIKYYKSLKLIQDKDYSGAIALLEAINNPNPQLITKIQPALNETIYQLALEFYNDNKLIDAEHLLNKIKYKLPSGDELLTKIRFEKGNNLFRQGNISDAEKILEEIAYKLPKAKEVLTELKIVKINKLIDDKRFIEAESILDKNKEIPEVAIKLAKVKYEIFQMYLNTFDAERAYGKLKEIRKINDNLELDEHKNRLTPVVSNCQIKLGIFYYDSGLKLEKKGDYINAKESYSNANTRLEKTKAIEPKKYFDSLCRYEIVKLKLGIEPEHNIISVFKTQSSAIKNDFFYRLILLLLKKNKLPEAEQILNENFKKSSEFEIEKLRTFFSSFHNKITKKLLTDYNTLVTQINNPDYPVSITLYEFWQQEIDQYTNNKKFIDSGFINEINNILPYLKKKLLFNFLETSNYEAVIDFISSTYSNFYLNPELVKIYGIAAFRLACGGKITNSNYKKAVSSFLSYVYSISVISESIKSANWYVDSEISFSLIGTKYITNPDSRLKYFNHREISDKNISIKNSQNELIEDFESQLQKHLNNVIFYEVVKSFYNNEKRIVSEIIGYISNDSLSFTPHFAEKNNLSLKILEDLNEVYTITSDEKILEIGTYYISNNKTSPSIFLEYRKAKKAVDSIINAVKNRAKNILQTYFIDENILLVKRFKSTVILEVADLDNMQSAYLNYLKFICLEPKESNINELITGIKSTLEEDYLMHRISSSESSQLFLILDNIISVESLLVKKLSQSEFNSFIFFIKQYGDYFYQRIIDDDSNLSDQDKRYRKILNYWQKLSGN